MCEKLNNELTKLRLHFEDRKLKIESLAHELVIARDECIILNDKCVIYVSESNLLVNDNMR